LFYPHLHTHTENSNKKYPQQIKNKSARPRPHRRRFCAHHRCPPPSPSPNHRTPDHRSPWIPPPRPWISSPCHHRLPRPRGESTVSQRASTGEALNRHGQRRSTTSSSLSSPAAHGCLGRCRHGSDGWWAEVAPASAACC
jgi:hypothetical protein